MKLLTGFSMSKIDRKLLWAGGITAVVYLFVLLTLLPGPFCFLMQATDDLFYHSYFKLRPNGYESTKDVAIVNVDDGSIKQVAQKYYCNLPWKRELYGYIAQYLAKCGAKAIVFDLLFEEQSNFNRMSGDDRTFARLISNLVDPTGSPVPDVFAQQVVRSDDTYKLGPFALPLRNHILGVASYFDFNADTQGALTNYDLKFGDYPSLAQSAVTAAGFKTVIPGEFQLHYYGPALGDRDRPAFSYSPASNVLKAATESGQAMRDAGIDPLKLASEFKGKIVLIGVTAAGGFDLKSSPISDRLPGVEWHATAIQNLIDGEAVSNLPLWGRLLLPIVVTIWSAFGVVYPRRAFVKLLFPALGTALLLGGGLILFHRYHIVWVPPARSLLAILLATPSAYSYTYFVEDKQSRAMLRAMEKVVSPEVARRLAKDPDKLQRNTEGRELTVLFSDIADFTTLSEAMKDDNQSLVHVLNDYLGAMSNEVIAKNGTLDKYIGDSVMCFWNAPEPQPDHAILACRAALAMKNLDKEYIGWTTPEGESKILRRTNENRNLMLPTEGIRRFSLYDRIGIHTSYANFGFVGSSHLMNFTVLGDGVNVAARLEGANKQYGSRILISQSTAAKTGDFFHMRRVDRICLKGKGEPLEVFELLAEKSQPLEPQLHKAVDRYNRAFDAYLNRDWQQAIDILLEQPILSDNTVGCYVDHPSEKLLERLRAYLLSPPHEPWDGVFRAKEK